MSQNRLDRSYIGFNDDMPLVVSRAAVLTLWAAVVAGRLGHHWGTALTLGKAVAGTTARLKLRVIGREQWIGGDQEAGPTLALDIPRIRRLPAMAHVLLLGRKIRLLPDASGQPRAALRTLPARDGTAADEYVAADPAEVERYLLKAFGARLTAVRAAMERLASCYEPETLNRIGLELYQQFQPGGPFSGQDASGKPVLTVEKILAMVPRPVHHENALAERNAPIRLW